MKKVLLTAFGLLLFMMANATINVKFGYKDSFGETSSVDLIDKKDINVLKSFTDLKRFTLTATLVANHELRIMITGEADKKYTTSDKLEEFVFTATVIGKEIVIEHYDMTGGGTGVKVANDDIKFRIINDIPEEAANTDPENTVVNVCENCNVNAFLAAHYSDESIYSNTPFGIYEKRAKTIHLFFDQFGNSVLSTVPQGISNAKYVVHIIYLFSSKNPDEISYSVKQKTGTFNSGLLFNNTDLRKDIGSLQAGKIYDGITERKFLLGTATDDLSFDIIATTSDGKKAKKTVLDSYVIKMTPVYHGSFDIGLLRTDLSNITYNHIQDPNSTNMVVKETDHSPKGVATIMASFYTSPIVLLQTLLQGKKSNVPFYKLTGRNFLDDHKFYERIYPTIGVSLTTKTFENIFYGFNFELARGLNLFAGWHYGKVNTFGMPDYKEGVSPVTQAQFEFYKNTKWKTSGAFGVKLDAIIIRNLFGIGM